MQDSPGPPASLENSFEKPEGPVEELAQEFAAQEGE